MTDHTALATRVHVALPAYNEEENLAKLLGRWEQVLDCMGQPHRFVIVDDGSKDGTPEILREWQERIPLDIVTHEVNQGLGSTIRDALRTASRDVDPDDVVITMDADNTHPPELVPCMLERMRDKRQRILDDPEGYRQDQIARRIPEDFDDLPDSEQQSIIDALEEVVASVDPADLKAAMGVGLEVRHLL